MYSLAFGFGSPADLAIIFIVALIVFGPKKLPEIGKQLGQAMRELRKVTDEMTGAVHSVQNEVESVYKPVLSPPSVVETTTSATVEREVTHHAYDQEPEALMEPVVKAVAAPVTEEMPAVKIAKHSAEEKGS